MASCNVESVVYNDPPERGGECVQDPGRLHGKAVQLDPMKLVLKAPGNKSLKSNYDYKPLSCVGFKFNLRRYTAGELRAKREATLVKGLRAAAVYNVGRGLHSFTFQLNLSRV